MHNRTDENGNRLPATPEEVKKKAEELRFTSKMYRAAYRAAFGVEAFKPYTHATYHLHQFQLKLQYDLKDYSTEAQRAPGQAGEDAHQGPFEWAADETGQEWEDGQGLRPAGVGVLLSQGAC
jgi:hypothetical protein